MTYAELLAQKDHRNNDTMNERDWLIAVLSADMSPSDAENLYRCADLQIEQMEYEEGMGVDDCIIARRYRAARSRANRGV